MQLTTNFNISEFRCNKAGLYNLPTVEVPPKYYENVSELAKNLQIIRNVIKKPILINSGYRTEEYNKRIGGASKSQHLTASASDIRILRLRPEFIYEVILELMQNNQITKGGLKAYKTFVHYDIRGEFVTW